ncbi:hypothetical protein X560_0392 [Listeria fleischmannii 1991]|uniref:Uncharacterized protein conserved in bacteria n=2 Tax=Listeria fleischmannii TaxID=1069827 RepID=A0A2X3HIS2_9LIST|nr:YxeA family protein [Listeria fleischmannii]EMG27525.1 hypothetical protein LFLEISCH_10819 [Listeria fleischmannii subsp. fleischmannii LU2006-1]KMT60972.1 hypothetical protein X560_0392 [Listeria fleischmannii 1991]SQC70585.1 Uncharacterized protein conserved in bacteria [Listeria fleischmannii subsp. fleischmannii]
MKKILIGIIAIIVVLAIGIGVTLVGKNYYKTTDYYVKITKNPIVKKEKASDGIIDTYYNYQVSGYDKNGKERKLKLESQDKMEINQYYLIHWEDRRSIISSKEKVSHDTIPSTIQEKLK